MSPSVALRSEAKSLLSPVHTAGDKVDHVEFNFVASVYRALVFSVGLYAIHESHFIPQHSLVVFSGKLAVKSAIFDLTWLLSRQFGDVITFGCLNLSAMFKAAQFRQFCGHY